MVENDVQVLLDRSEISQMLCRLALGMDLRDREMFQACWADEFYLSVPPLAGEAVPLEGNMRAEEHAHNRYDFKCARTPAGWKITDMIWTRHWSTGNGGLWDMVGKRVAAKAAAEA